LFLALVELLASFVLAFLSIGWKCSTLKVGKTLRIALNYPATCVVDGISESTPLGGCDA
jgi:hypothetical protein